MPDALACVEEAVMKNVRTVMKEVGMRKFLTCAPLVALLAACATPGERTAIGGGGGAAVGAGIGALAGGWKGALIGAAAGGLLGAVVGHTIDVDHP